MKLLAKFVFGGIIVGTIIDLFLFVGGGFFILKFLKIDRPFGVIPIILYILVTSIGIAAVIVGVIKLWKLKQKRKEKISENFRKSVKK